MKKLLLIPICLALGLVFLTRADETGANSAQRFDDHNYFSGYYFTNNGAGFIFTRTNRQFFHILDGSPVFHLDSAVEFHGTVGGADMHLTALDVNGRDFYRIVGDVAHDFDGEVNAHIGGRVHTYSNPIFSAGTSETNVWAFIVTSKLIGGSPTIIVGDSLSIRLSGRFSDAADAKRLKLKYGTTVLWDSTSQTVNGGAYVVTAELFYIDDTHQSFNVSYQGAGSSTFTTMAVGISEEASTATKNLELAATCAADGGITNCTASIDWHQGLNQ